MHPHLKERFYQRYGMELTEPALREITEAASRSTNFELVDKWNPGREKVWLYWGGQEIRMVWYRARRRVLTFLPGRIKMARWVGKGRRR